MKNRSFSTQAGFSLIEVLVAIGLFSVVSATIYSVMFSGVRGSELAGDVSRISDEARAGFNRMIRDAREGRDLDLTQDDQFIVKTDFDDSNSFENPNTQGDFELLTFRHEGDRITLNGETLIEGVSTIPGRDVFSYTSNLLEYDWSGDGITTCLELNDAPSHGVLGVGDSDTGPDYCDDREHDFISNIDFAFEVTIGDRTTEFFAQAQMRNQR